MLKSGMPTLVNPARVDPLGPMQPAGGNLRLLRAGPFWADASLPMTTARSNRDACKVQGLPPLFTRELARGGARVYFPGQLAGLKKVVAKYHAAALQATAGHRKLTNHSAVCY
jgi:hypothetical protein